MSDEENTFAAGTILAGRYQVRRELGRGGMGVVYLCRDLVVDERVALKLLVKRGSKIRPEDAWWFHEEARALAGLSHPSIVRARDFGSLPDGTPYLVMDYVAGRSLHEWLYLGKIEGQLPWPIIAQGEQGLWQGRGWPSCGEGRASPRGRVSLCEGSVDLAGG